MSLKKIIPVTGIAIYSMFSSLTYAQQTFELTEPNTIEIDTSGTIGEGFVTFENALVNTSSEAFSYKWNLISKDVPQGWSLVGFCDNSNCFPPSNWQGFQVLTSNPVPPNDPTPDVSGTLHLQITAPVSASDGIATVKFRVFTDDQSDTLTFILKKGDPTGVSIINQNDARVKLFPNPAASYISVFAAQSLNPKSISILNVEGRQMAITGIKAGNETTNMNISSLASGMYMVRITDADNKVITSRKFTKQ